MRLPNIPASLRPLLFAAVVLALLLGAFSFVADEAMRVLSSSFPSGHAAVSAVAYVTLAALLAPLCADRRLAVLCIVAGVFLTLLVGVSRIHLGVHYPTDVIAGWALLYRVGANVLGLSRR